MLLVPNFPCGKGLQQQHFKSVLGDGSLRFAFLHEECFIWIIQQIVEQMVGSKQFVGYVRAEIHFGNMPTGVQFTMTVCPAMISGVSSP